MNIWPNPHAGHNQARPTITAGCMDCNWQDKQHTNTDAYKSLEAHYAEHFGHRALISDTNGWHRHAGDWLGRPPRLYLEQTGGKND